MDTPEKILKLIYESTPAELRHVIPTLKALFRSCILRSLLPASADPTPYAKIQEEGLIKDVIVMINGMKKEEKFSFLRLLQGDGHRWECYPK